MIPARKNCSSERTWCGCITAGPVFGAGNLGAKTTELDYFKIVGLQGDVETHALSLIGR